MVVERSPGLQSSLYGLVAQAKEAILGMLDREAFMIACFKLQELM